MAFADLVQDDAGSVLDAVSYVTVAEFRAHHLARGTDVSTYTDSQVEAALTKATDYMDGRFGFIGEKPVTDQRTQWPRVNAIDVYDRLRSGIPLEVKEAQHEYAFIALTSELNPSPTRDATGRVIQSKSVVVGPIEKSITYAGSASFSLPKYPKADSRLRPVLSAGGLEFERA
jgi:hypothetical protein